MPSSKFIIPADYAHWLSSLKTRISGAQQRAALAVNQDLVRLYHHIGSEILERQPRQGWGAKVIDRLASDLREAFPEMKGFSSSNLKYMRFFAQQCPSGLIGQQPADQLPWGHNIVLLTRLKSPDWFRKGHDVRWQFGVPPKGNANFAWVQHFIHHLAPHGMAGFVLANGSMSSNQFGEGDIRRALIEADLVDCMVALPGQLFYSTQPIEALAA